MYILLLFKLNDHDISWYLILTKLLVKYTHYYTIFPRRLDYNLFRFVFKTMW